MAAELRRPCNYGLEDAERPGKRGSRSGRSQGGGRVAQGLGDAPVAADRRRWSALPKLEDEEDAGDAGCPAMLGWHRRSRMERRTSWSAQKVEGEAVAAMVASGGDGAFGCA